MPAIQAAERRTALRLLRGALRSGSFSIWLPKMDGLQVLREMRGSGSRTPVLIPDRARCASQIACKGSIVRASDYLNKPSSRRNWSAGRRALLRRGQGGTPRLTCRHPGLRLGGTPCTGQRSGGAVAAQLSCWKPCCSPGQVVSKDS